MVFAGPARVLAEGDVEQPVKIVLHAPVRAHRGGEATRVGWGKEERKRRVWVEVAPVFLIVRRAVTLTMLVNPFHSG